MTAKTWQKPGTHFEIEEEGLNWEEKKYEIDDSECSNQKNYELAKGEVYSGQMKQNPDKPGKKNLIPHGKGTLTMDDGSVIEGLWKNSEAFEGLKIYSNGDRYQGYFSGNVPNGHGVLTQTDRATYEGTWQSGSIVAGTEVTPEGEFYKGQFHNRKRHGLGEIFVDGTSIKKGRWELGQLMELQGDIKGDDGNFLGQTDLNGKNARLQFADN